jgi:hypothetical protein
VASGALAVKDATNTSVELSTEADAANSNRRMTKHVMANSAGDMVGVEHTSARVKVIDGAGTNKLAIDAGGRVTAVISDGTDTIAISAAGAASTTDTNLSTAAALADAAALPTTTKVGAAGMLYNGATLDLERNNTDVVILASAARMAAVQGDDTRAYNAKGLTVVVDVTVIPSDNITMTIQGKDANGVYYDLLVGAAISTVSTNVYVVGLGAAVTANASANRPVPKVVRVNMAVSNGATSITYSVSLALSA